MIELKSIDRAKTLRYLTHNHTLMPDAKLTTFLNACETEFCAAAHPRYIYRDFSVAKIYSRNVDDKLDDAKATHVANPAAAQADDYVNSVALQGVKLAGCDLFFKGQTIAKHLTGCDKVLLLAATLGDGPDKLIRLSQIDDMERAIVFDAMANVAIEQVCDQIEEAMHLQCPDSYFTWRFSPGYGDFPIEVQSAFLTVLDAPRKIGLYATDSSLLTPGKSVTAVIGISDAELPKKKRSCQNCNLYNTCTFRKGDLHCE